MPTTTHPDSTVGASIAGSDTIQAAISSIVEEVRTRSASITAARPPSGPLVEGLDQWLERSADVRGRGGYFRYLGSGAGNGPLVELADGSVKWDLINGIGVHMFGHGDPVLIEASLRAALSDVGMHGNLQFNAEAVEFAEILRNEAARTSRLRHCFVTNSGCMANESALKVCQQKTGGAPRVIAFADCFMGRSTTMSQIGDAAGNRQGLALNTLVDYLPFYDPSLGDRAIEMTAWHLEQLVARYPGQHCCLVAELVQGEGGFRTAPRAFFTRLFEIARKAGIPIWADEVQTFGRTESMYAFEGLDLGEYIDVVTVGKITQACACLYTEELNPGPGLLSGTFSAAVGSFATGISILTRLRDGGYYGPDGRIARLHRAFRTHAEAFVAKHPEWFPEIPLALGRTSREFVAGTGGMMRLTPFGGDKARIGRLLQNLFEDGIIAFSCGHGPYHLRFLPPVGVMEPGHFDPVFEILERSFARTA